MTENKSSLNWFRMLLGPTHFTDPRTSVPLYRGPVAGLVTQTTRVQGYRGTGVVCKVVWAKPQLGYCISFRTVSFSYFIDNMS